MATRTLDRPRGMRVDLLAILTAGLATAAMVLAIIAYPVAGWGRRTAARRAQQ